MFQDVFIEMSLQHLEWIVEILDDNCLVGRCHCLSVLAQLKRFATPSVPHQFVECDEFLTLIKFPNSTKLEKVLTLTPCILSCTYSSMIEGEFGG